MIKTRTNFTYNIDRRQTDKHTTDAQTKKRQIDKETQPKKRQRGKETNYRQRYKKTK